MHATRNVTTLSPLPRMLLPSNRLSVKRKKTVRRTWPAIMLANSRMASVSGLMMKTENSSIGVRIT
jgi:hypothetical protein